LAKSYSVYLHNIYAPSEPGEREGFFAALPTGFEPDAQHIVGGDFNVILSEKLDSFQPLSGNLQRVKALTQWLTALSLVDVYRQDNPTTISYTSPKHNNRLDYIFVSESMYVSAKTTSTHIHADTSSDHSACTFELAPQARRSTGPWRTPQWLTKLPEAATIVHTCLDKYLDAAPAGPDVVKLYDSMVYDMRSQLRQLHRDRVNADAAPRRELEQELTVALRDLSRHPCQVSIDALLDIKSRLREYHDLARKHKA